MSVLTGNKWWFVAVVPTHLVRVCSAHSTQGCRTHGRRDLADLFLCLQQQHTAGLLASGGGRLLGCCAAPVGLTHRRVTRTSACNDNTQLRFLLVS